MIEYPSEIEIEPAAGPVNVTVAVPGSKSITNRALVLAALACRQREITLEGALQSEDTEVMVDCLRRLGFTLTVDWPTVHVHRNISGRIIPAASADLFVGNSGTTVRFLTAMLTLCRGTYRLDGIPRMRERPIADLLAAINQLGANATSDAGTGCPPITLRPEGWSGGTVGVRADVSSQFLSGLMLAAPFADTPTAIVIDGPSVSEPYIDMSYRMVRDWGLSLERTSNGFAARPSDISAIPATYAIEPDASTASYPLALAAILGGRVTVTGLNRTSLQGDVAFAEALQRMGCRVEECDSGITVHGGKLRGIDIDMNAISDTVMTLAAVACFAEGPTTIRNVAHIRHKETDRIAAVANELRRLGLNIDERDDGLTIHPGHMTGAKVETYNDHRMAMSLALIGLRVPKVVVDHPACVAKTYPGFWHDLARWRQSPPVS
jgi:3-phosphoshikimate 1-carboxyvinyltransferase